MTNLAKSLPRATALAALMTASALSYAGCPGGAEYYSVSEDPDHAHVQTITIAVASNFKDAATDLAKTFVLGTGYVINICETASGVFAEEIIGGNPNHFSLFLSADEGFAYAVKDAGVGIDEPFLYAKGTPAFVLSNEAFDPYRTKPEIYAAGEFLVQDQVIGAFAEASGGYSITNNVRLERPNNVSFLAIGNVVDAPYGAAAKWVLEDMWQWMDGEVHNAGADVSTPCEALTSGTDKWICEYKNISETLRAIDNNAVTAGFVSYAQICNNTASYPNSRYALFPENATEQFGVRINIDNPYAHFVAEAFVASWNIGSSVWDEFLTARCYQAPFDPQL